MSTSRAENHTIKQQHPWEGTAQVGHQRTGLWWTSALIWTCPPHRPASRFLHWRLVSSPSGVKVSPEWTGRLRSETDELFPYWTRLVKVRPSIVGCISSVDWRPSELRDLQHNELLLQRAYIMHTRHGKKIRQNSNISAVTGSLKARENNLEMGKSSFGKKVGCWKPWTWYAASD